MTGYASPIWIISARRLKLCIFDVRDFSATEVTRMPATVRHHGTIAVALRCRSMIKNIAYAALLAQIAVISGLIAQTLLSTPTHAANVQPGVKAAVVVSDEECNKTTWPDIPQHCLERVAARKQMTMLVLTPAK